MREQPIHQPMPATHQPPSFAEKPSSPSPIRSPPDAESSSQSPKSLVRGVVVGGLAACAAVTISNPLEVVKTRLQLQGELTTTSGKTGPYKNSFHALWMILRREGLRGVQKGIVPAYGYQFVMNGMRLGLYEPFKRMYGRYMPDERERVGSRQGADGVKPNSVVNVASAMTAGVMGAFLASPLYLVKTRLQSYTTSPTLAVGHQHAYRNLFHGLVSIYQQENGLRGIFRGSSASMLRTSVGSGVQLAFYDRIKYTFPSDAQNQITTHLSSAFLTGVVVCVFMNPFDVVTTRVYNQKSQERGQCSAALRRGGSLYKGPLDCFSKTWKAEGWRGFYKGATAQWLRIGPHTVLTLVFLEQFRRLANLYFPL